MKLKNSLQICLCIAISTMCAITSHTDKPKRQGSYLQSQKSLDFMIKKYGTIGFCAHVLGITNTLLALSNNPNKDFFHLKFILNKNYYFSKNQTSLATISLKEKPCFPQNIHLPYDLHRSAELAFLQQAISQQEQDYSETSSE